MEKIFEETLAAANAGNPLAQHDLGIMYGKGIHVGQDMSKAMEWFRKAALQGLPEAIKILRQFAEQGIEPAQYHLGAMYANGQGVEKNYEEAARWYKMAADRGMREAQANLGMMYYFGQGVEQSYTKALELSRQAAALGNTRARFLVGTLYALGQGVAMDYREAYLWFSRAIVSASPDETEVRDRAMVSINTIAPHISPEQRAEVVEILKGDGIDIRPLGA